MRKRTRPRRPEFVGRRWEIVVKDGNGDMWVTNFPDCPMGPVIKWHGDMTPTTASDIVRALRAAADRWEATMPKAGAGEVVPFKPK